MASICHRKYPHPTDDRLSIFFTFGVLRRAVQYRQKSSVKEVLLHIVRKQFVPGDGSGNVVSKFKTSEKLAGEDALQFQKFWSQVCRLSLEKNESIVLVGGVLKE